VLSVHSDDDVENDPSQKVDDAEEEDDGEREAKWRMERLEREKFLEQHQVGSLCCFGARQPICLFWHQVISFLLDSFGHLVSMVGLN